MQSQASGPRPGGRSEVDYPDPAPTTCPSRPGALRENVRKLAQIGAGVILFAGKARVRRKRCCFGASSWRWGRGWRGAPRVGPFLQGGFPPARRSKKPGTAGGKAGGVPGLTPPAAFIKPPPPSPNFKRPWTPFGARVQSLGDELASLEAAPAGTGARTPASTLKVAYVDLTGLMNEIFQQELREKLQPLA